MLTKDRFTRITTLALPIVGAMVSQNILNLVDTAMVGALGPTALAAVGIGGFANFMAVAAIIGLSSGVQAMASRRKGEGRVDEMAIPLNGGLFLALVIGLPMSAILYVSAPVLFPIINSDPGVAGEGVAYLQARLLGMVAVGMNFSYRGYWNGVSLSGLYMRTLLIVHAVNIAISYVLIFGKFGFPAMGAEGAGLGTSIALGLGTVIFTVHALRLAKPHGFLTRIPRGETMMTMLRLALPTAMQQFLFASGMTMFFWIIGQVGVNEVAASNVIVNLLLVALLPGMGMGLAALTLVGEALGRKETADAKRWGWDVVVVATVVMGCIGAIGLIAPRLVLSGFLHDPAVLELAVSPLRIVAIMMIFEGTSLVLLNGLLGAGAAQRVMMVSVGTQWLVGLPLAWLVGPYLGLGLFWIWMANGGYRLLQTAIFAILWHRGRWAGISV
ncbi:MAG: MATE family efflux transporter [Rhodospirillaceae bacterium]|nr:MATE family efflux transporter [Rhodospirillaceae bacterium]